MLFRFLCWSICAVLIFPGCKKSEAVVFVEEVAEPTSSELLSAYFLTDTSHCLYAVYRALDFELPWMEDTLKRAELLHLIGDPLSIGLLPDTGFSVARINEFWTGQGVDSIPGIPLLAEFSSTHILNYLFQRLETGSSNVPSSACPDSAASVKLAGILSEPSLKEGLLKYLPADLNQQVQWISRFYGAANMDYAPEPIPVYKKDSAKSMEAVLAALTQYGLMSEMPDSMFTGDTILFALRQFQRENGLEPDGVIGSRTRRALEKTNKERYGQLLANLERTRNQLNWEKGTAHIEVNVPEYVLRFYVDGELIRKHKVIVGKRKEHKTPNFKASMNEIVINPTWNVPYSISTKELLPKQQNDSCYLHDHHYIVYNGGGDVVDPIEIDWRSLSIGNFPYDIVQEPGRINALGTIKFLFPNKYSVYLHDTPSKRLFATYDRDYSHGCIRLEDPYPLALDILEYVNSKVDSTEFFGLLDTAEVYSIPIYPKIPVIVNYRSVGESEDGEYLIFYHDLYGRDKEWVARIKDLDL